MNVHRTRVPRRPSPLAMLAVTGLMLAATAVTAAEQAPSLAMTLEWLRRMPPIVGAPADRFTALSIDDLRRLREIRLGGHRLADNKHVELKAEELRHLTALPALATARLSEIHGLNDAALAHLGKIRTLTHLELGDAQITGEGLAHLSELENLTHLNVAFARKVGDAGIPHLGRLRKLELLVLSGTQITDAGLASLSELPRLAEIRIKATPITDVGLIHLRRHRSLKLMKIDNKGKVTPNGIAELRKVLPECQVTQ
ncbi:MAG: hypothetical protein ACO1SX_23425 [Actinomycetota bacterium]